MSHETIAKVASDATYAGSGLAVGSAASVVFGLTVTQWTVIGIIFGMLMALAGWITNVVFSHRREKFLIAQGNAWNPLNDGE